MLHACNAPSALEILSQHVLSPHVRTVYVPLASYILPYVLYTYHYPAIHYRTYCIRAIIQLYITVPTVYVPLSNYTLPYELYMYHDPTIHYRTYCIRATIQLYITVRTVYVPRFNYTLPCVLYTCHYQTIHYRIVLYTCHYPTIHYRLNERSSYERLQRVSKSTQHKMRRCSPRSARRANCTNLSLHRHSYGRDAYR